MPAKSTLGLLTSSTLIDNVALNGTLSPPLPVKVGVPQGNVLSPIFFLIFFNDLTDSLENPLYVFPDDPTLCREISRTSSLSSDLNKMTNWSNTILPMYTHCPPFSFSLSPHHYLHPLFVHLCPLSSSALLLVFPLSPAVPFVMLCPDLFCVIALPRA